VLDLENPTLLVNIGVPVGLAVASICADRAKIRLRLKVLVPASANDFEKRPDPRKDLLLDKLLVLDNVRVLEKPAVPVICLDLVKLRLTLKLFVLASPADFERLSDLAKVLVLGNPFVSVKTPVVENTSVLLIRSEAVKVPVALKVLVLKNAPDVRKRTDPTWALDLDNPTVLLKARRVLPNLVE
jgi:hypothetical protein